MNNFQDLPEGISINRSIKDFYYEIEYELIDTVKCNKCPVFYESLLMSNVSRLSGRIMIYPSNSIVWKNDLSKNRDKALKNLKDALTLRFDKHKERCKND